MTWIKTVSPSEFFNYINRIADALGVGRSKSFPATPFMLLFQVRPEATGKILAHV